MEDKSPQPSAEEQKEPQTNQTPDQGKPSAAKQKKLKDATAEKTVTKQKKEPETTVSLISEEKTETNSEETSDAPEQEQDQKTKTEVEKTQGSEKEQVQKSEAEEKIDYTKLTIQELIETYKSLSTQENWLKNHSELQNLAALFEHKFHADVEANKKAFIEEGGNEIDFFYKPEYKKAFDQLGFEYRKKRRTHYKELEATQKINLERKKAIIEEIKGLIGADENINTIYKKFRTLQESWYSTGAVTRTENQSLWETFKHHTERFYDFLHLNRELRELDFKHNYEEKLKIIEKAEALKDLPDIIRASRDLNTLHKLWKNDLGPVAKEHREELWKRFQEATKIIQSRRQEYQKDIVGAMQENLSKKETLLKEMQSIVDSDPKSHNSWQNALKKFNGLRDTFKTIGYVPTKESKATWQKFREIGRDFMHKKNVFYKNQKKEYNTNVEAKKEFITQSKQILEAPDWDAKVQEMKNLQKEWKAIGFVPRKLDNKLWSEFSEIHKTFFDRIKSGYQHLNEEQELLKDKKITFINSLQSAKFSESSEALLSELKSSWENWNAMQKIGGSTELDLNKKFTAELTKAAKKANSDKKVQKEVLLKLEILLLQNNPDKLQKQLNEVKENLNKLKTERTQLENNLEFFSHSSSENPLYKNVEKQINNCIQKIDKAKEEYIRLKQIKNAQEKLANQEQLEINEEAGNQDSESE